MAIQYFCDHEERKNLVRLGDKPYNGIDYLEVADEAQLKLQVRFLKSLSADALKVENVRIEGGARIRNVAVKTVSITGDVLTVTVDKAGDFSPYILRLVQGVGSDAPPAWVDPILSWVEFSFKVACPSDFDCKQEPKCPPETLPEPEIDYLAKDYGSFRRLMLDRLSVVMPQWKERNPADIGVAAVEAFAYAADRLSYFQDAVATEAYLGTALKRVSVRRHARLLDYLMHDGCNARVWVVMEAGEGADLYVLRAHTPLLTGGAQPLEQKVCTAAIAPAPGPALELGQFSLFALESVCIQEQADVHSGHIGANREATATEAVEAGPGSMSSMAAERERDADGKGGGGGSGGGGGNGGSGGGGGGEDNGDALFPCESGWSVVIGTGVRLNNVKTAVYGDRLKIMADAKVYDVFYNSLDNQGTIRGIEHHPLSLPLLSYLPGMPSVPFGADDIALGEHETRTLAPGGYRDMVLGDHATLCLSGGRYDFRSWRISEHAKVLFSGPAEIRIAGRLRTEANAQVMPSEDISSVSGRDIIIYAGGEPDESTGYSPVAVDIGEGNHINATIYAPEGLLVIGSGTNAAGTFYGRWVSVGAQAQIRLPAESAQASGAGTQSGGPRISITSLAGDAQVFETMHDTTLRSAYNRIEFYTWGDEKCCLPRGATRASLKNEENTLRYLKKGDLLLFEEVAGTNGRKEDADASHRHVVRLTGVEFVTDPLYDEAVPYTVGGTEQRAMRVVNIEWAPEDALPFPLCLHVVDILVDPQTGRMEQGPVGIARGNVVPADHGRTFCNEDLAPNTPPASGRYFPRLPRTDITFRVPYDDEAARTRPAGSVMLQNPREALPDVELRGNDELWSVRRDLLESDRFAQEYVVETEDDGRAYLRFGDNILGKRPAAGVTFRATYRVGNGAAGNVGAETINQVVLSSGESDIQKAIKVRNPLLAQGGTEAEAVEQVKLYAPQAFRTQKRAVTPDDFVDMVERHPEVQKAVASQRWTGSWHTVFITVDRRGGRPVDDAFERELRDFLEPYRMMGHDLEIDAPRPVALDIALRVCIGAEYQRVGVKAALQDVFSSGLRSDGRTGFFHPDNFTFGQHVYLSAVISEAMQVPGVVWAAADRFQRWGQEPQSELKNGVIRMDNLEIARLDNDPNAPENGRIEFLMQGGL